MIRLVDVCKRYNHEVLALDSVSLHIKKGDFVFLVGSSGAGKSTLIKLLLKEEEPTSGRIFMNNREITRLAGRQVPFLRREMGVVFQDFRLLPKKTVFENVAFAMEMTGISAKQIRKQVPMILSMVALSNRANNYPNQLSGGEQQRVSIARAIVNNPTVLIADEPTGNLDPDTSWEIMKLLSFINKRGTTVIMATHNREIVDIMQKRVVVLEKGKIVSDEMRGVYKNER
jgi:cell division transport system ATP-binding protein